ncbi:Signal transduction histidine kinase [Hoeflea phototrophica DFL-43]|uniref:Signal transduction histidine kinase n=1 Tax=Hoeflea phototrophica (strain DSM 17068 / NCIMB 14078 / DFL-43) TaxID=411684 RepID=A9DFR3_HOEPD|nr:ATP-binding protein [Hoeflea phototrophica]EDQ31652.1 Signal transduction histidine kinase [Hoeflea phototrophica DFL-43]
MRTVGFKTTARTVDHLGREQIADVPTAISELWKNSYDAYARSVSLTIFDEDPLVVTIADDGHGMNIEELIDRWLVVGTESKLFGDGRSDEDRDGLEPRTRQGQKGIGRLSSAHLGPLMLLLTKRRRQKMAAALIDWRLFENPFLVLTDIEIPVIEFDDHNEITEFLPLMTEALLENVLGTGLEDGRSLRMIDAWSRYDLAVQAEGRNGDKAAPSLSIVTACRSFKLTNEYLAPWSAWSGAADKGTAMVVSGASEEFAALLPANSQLSTAKEDKARFERTLGGFVDPLYDPAIPEINAAMPDFEYGVFLSSNGHSRKIIGSAAEFNRSLTDRMEHIVDGRIDEKGVFRGQIKSFGKWRKVGTEYEIRPPKEFVLPTGSGTLLGPVDVYFATFEQEPKNTSHTPIEFEYLKQHASPHAGLMIYRNGLRVLPYGREDNDFFEIEKRRSINAGREYWNSRRIFGRIAISREHNPNLKDKAGREGFIVNKAAKTLKVLIVNILRSSAYDYFGSNSDDRAVELADARSNFAEHKAKESQAKLRQKQRRSFRKNLKARIASIPSVSERLRADIKATRIEFADDIPTAQECLEAVQASIAELRLPGAPSPLGTLEEEYRSYRRAMTELNQMVADFSNSIASAVEKINPPSPEEIVLKQIQRNEGQLTSRVTRWSKEIRVLQDAERDRISDLVSERNKLLREETMPLIEQTASGRLSLTSASRSVVDAKNRIDGENELLFQNYILALENLKESIDIQAVAILAGEENNELRSTVDRLNGLAQLGITVEFLDHELHSHDSVIDEGILKLKKKLGKDKDLEQLAMGYAGLKQILDFLGPLRMAGRPQPRDIGGDYIDQYVSDFFGRTLAESGIELVATPAFRRFNVFDQPSRLLPVFVNLVNNSIYWLVNARVEGPKILLDVRDDEVFVADNGPGVDEIDLKRLFTLFFTRKIEGGRGIGLYLSQANLAAGGHTIRYVQEDDRKILSGANFAMKFRGANIND